MNAAELHYKVSWRASGSYPGHHASQQQGGGLQFRHHVPLLNAPDPRRFDVRASLRDPFEQVQVRVYQQTSSIPVFVIADLSASMAYAGARNKMDELAQFVAALSYSAYRTGDTFGFIGCSDQASTPWVLPPTLNRAAGAALAGELRAYTPRGHSCTGLAQAAELVGSRRALIFLLSDFHFPLPQIEGLLAALSYHDVVPVMLWDRREHVDLPAFGIVRVVDDETGHSRMLLMRPRLKKRIEEAFAARRAELQALFGDFGRRPLELFEGFSADEVSRYFFE